MKSTSASWMKSTSSLGPRLVLTRVDQQPVLGRIHAQKCNF